MSLEFEKKGWKRCTLGDIVTFKRGFDLSKEKMVEGQYPVVGSNGIIGYHDEFTTDTPGITIGRSGNVGLPFLIKEPSWSHNTTLYIQEFKNVDPYFIYYFLKTIDLKQFAGGSAVPTLNRNHIHPIDIIIPEDINIQKKIAKILLQLDEKIELNQQINHNLEEVLSLIFEDYFVKCSAYDENSLVKTDWGQIPKEWKNIDFGEIIQITSGERPDEKSEVKTAEFDIPLFGASKIMGYTKEFTYNENILVIGRVGTHGVIQRVNYPCFPSDNTFVIKSKYYGFVYQILKRIDYDSLNTGSTQPLITQKSLKNVNVILPDDETLSKFEIISKTIFDKVYLNQKEIINLTKLRDTLLPKLMSGEIDVSGITYDL